MSSSYNGQNIFGSGPHRFAMALQGQSVVPNYVLNLPPPGSTPQGLRELDVIVKGRLVASSESALWSLRDTVVSKITDPPTSASLVDHHGRTWTSMSFITYEEGARVDRGRAYSVEYTAVFRRFLK